MIFSNVFKGECLSYRVKKWLSKDKIANKNSDNQKKIEKSDAMLLITVVISNKIMCYVQIFVLFNIYNCKICRDILAISKKL